MAPGLGPKPCPEGHRPQVWEKGLGEGGTCSLLPLWVQLQSEDRVLQLTEEPLQHISDILNEVVVDAQLDVAGVPPKLLHQYLDPGLGSVLAVNPFMPQPWGRDIGSWGLNPALRPQWGWCPKSGASCPDPWLLCVCQRMLQLCCCNAGLTILCDEGNTAVHDDGDVPPAQLLVP